MYFCESVFLVAPGAVVRTPPGGRLLLVGQRVAAGVHEPRPGGRRVARTAAGTCLRSDGSGVGRVVA